MTTEAQFIANRENAKTAGVKTEGGKQVVRWNAIKHGLSGNSDFIHLRIFSESKEAYETILDGLVEALKPQDALEVGLIEKMAKSSFKLRRCDKAEADSFEISYVCDKLTISSGMDLVLRYRIALENTYFKTLATLWELRRIKELDLFRSEGVSK